MTQTFHTGPHDSLWKVGFDQPLKIGLGFLVCQRIWSVVIRRVLRLAFISNQMSLSKDVVLEALEVSY